MTEEIKKDKVDAVNAPAAKVLDKPVEAAAEVAAELEREDAGIPADKTVETIAEIDEKEAKAEASADATTHDVSHLEPHVEKTGDQKNAEVAETALAGTRAALAGEHTKVGDGSEVDLNPQKLSFTTADAKAVRKDPTSSERAHALTEERKGRIAKFREFLETRILAGRKDIEQQAVSTELPPNVVPFPNANAQPVGPVDNQPRQELPKAA